MMEPSAANRHGRGREGERGSVIVLVGILIAALLLFFGFVIDIGNWFVHKRHLQMQADAAALAGGAYFGDCFSPDAAVAATANSTIMDKATQYAGTENASGPGYTAGAASIYNLQIGGGAPRMRTLYNSRTFAVGGPPPDDTETDGPCQTPSLMLDVKQTEADVPYILGSLVDSVVPGGGTVVPAINARARVELKKATIVSGSLPLAVPDVDPRHVTATFVNESSGGALLAGPFELTKGSTANGLRYWSGSGSVTVPSSGAKIGVRIGLGGQSATCAAANGTGGDGFVCYDYTNTDIGLIAIDGVGSGGTVNVPKPRVWATTACTGSPFFSDLFVASPATTCSASVQAVMQTSSGTVGPAQKAQFDAVLNGAALKNVTNPFTYDSANGYWTTGYVFAVPVQGGPVDVSLVWKSTTGSKQTYPDIQRIYSASDDDSGPVKALALSSPTSTLGSPYTLSAGTHTITVDVGLEGNLSLLDTTDTVMLRLTGGSRTTAVACDGTGANEFRNSIVNGCQTPYQLNSAGYCPDPDPPAGPADCVPTETGEMAGPTLQALDQRFAACPDNNWPDYDAANDPRVVKLMITDFSALGGNGTTDVPVTNFAAFYVTGWTNSTCTNNDPPPGDVKKGAIWGHFVKYVEPDPNSVGDETCDPLAITPCIPVLVK